MAAEYGNPDAQCRLGIMYNIGIGVPSDETIAVKYLCDAAEGGSGKAAFTLGQIYKTKKDNVLTERYLLKASEMGESKAMVLLAEMYENGVDSVAPNLAEAVRWLSAAVDDPVGNQEAECRLGILYRIGKGVDKDLAKAFSLLSRSAEKANAIAQFQLGEIKFGRAPLSVLHLYNSQTPNNQVICTSKAKVWKRTLLKA
jgi:TPR repeat protein